MRATAGAVKVLIVGPRFAANADAPSRSGAVRIKLAAVVVLAAFGTGGTDVVYASGGTTKCGTIRVALGEGHGRFRVGKRPMGSPATRLSCRRARRVIRNYWGRGNPPRWACSSGTNLRTTCTTGNRIGWRVTGVFIGDAARTRGLAN